MCDFSGLTTGNYEALSISPHGVKLPSPNQTGYMANALLFLERGAVKDSVPWLVIAFHIFRYLALGISFLGLSEALGRGLL